MNRPGQQRGVVMLVVLGIIAVATVSAVNMRGSQSLTVRRFQGYQNIQQAEAIAVAAERFAAATLFRDAPENDAVDSREDSWAITIPPLPVAGGTISGCVYDQQGQFNLNNLVDENGVADPIQLTLFMRLLDALALNRDIGRALIDWLDTDAEPQLEGGGAELETYVAQDPPYRPANRPMVSTTELRQVHGLNGSDDEALEAYEALLPYVVALPRGTLINVNTASPELISALGDDLSELGDTLHRWPDNGWQLYPRCGEGVDISSAISGSVDADGEDRTPYDSVDAFIAAMVAAGGQDQALSDAVKTLLSVSSTHFLVRADVEFGESTMTQYSVLQRETDGRSTVIRRWQSLD